MKLTRFHPVLYMAFFLIVFAAVPVQAQTEEESSQRLKFFIAPQIEILGFSREGPAFGGGFAIGAEDRIAIGTRLMYMLDSEGLNTMEIAVFMRFYLLNSKDCTGLFVQVNGGAVVFEYKDNVSLPSEFGSLSAGISAGWRFPLRERWYIEPAIRAGYPFMVGVGLSAGFRF